MVKTGFCMESTMDEQGGNNNNNVMRDYRKGNWTPNETMILIEAKKMDDERRMKSHEGRSNSGSSSSNKPTELRWKWVEDYCWKKGCFRSQNQCNDKWDNLMRDYKKVRDHESKIDHHHDHGSYWKLEKIQRKERNLPSNLSFAIYQALVEVVEKKNGAPRNVAGAAVSTAVCGGSSSPYNVGYIHSLPPLLQHHHVITSSSIPTSSLSLPPPPPPLPPPALPAQPSPPPTFVPCTQALPIVDSDTSEHSDSRAKRRRRGGGGEGTSGGSAARTTTTAAEEIGSAISKSASMIAKALKKSEEREERRHNHIIKLHETRLKIEETKLEINQQGFNGLVDAINKLANSILALASSSKSK